MQRLKPFTKVMLIFIMPSLFLCVLSTIKMAAMPDRQSPFWKGQGAGEEQVFGQIKTGIDLLRKNKIHDYALNYAALGRLQGLWEHRTIEGAWPIRYAETSHQILSAEAITKPGCRLIDQSNGIRLYVCS